MATPIPMLPKYNIERTQVETVKPSGLTRSFSIGEVHLHMKIDKSAPEKPAKIKHKVLYIHPDRRSEYLVTYNQMKHIWMRGQQPMPKNEDFSFILTRDKQMFLYTNKDVTYVQQNYNASDVILKHSSLSGGEDVYFAADGYVADDGTLVYNDRSGHYHATENLPFFQSWLEQQHVPSHYIGPDKMKEHKAKSEGKSQVKIPTFQNEPPANKNAGMGPPSLFD